MTDRNANRKGYKKTPVGWIPEEWGSASLQSLTAPTAPIVYGIVQAGPNIEDGVPYIRSTDVGEREVSARHLLKTTPEIAQKYKRAAVAPGDIVFSLRGNIGETSIVPPDLAGANLTQGTARIRPTKTTDSHFVRYSLAAYGARRLVDVWSKGSTFREITIEDLRHVLIPIPPLPEQKNLAEILSIWDDAIEQTRALIAVAKRRKKALMQQLLTGKKRLPEFASEMVRREDALTKGAHATLHPLKDIRCVCLSDIVERIVESPASTKGYPVLSITAGKGFVSQEEKFSKVIAGRHIEHYVLLKKGEFAYNKGNSSRFPQGCAYRLREYDAGLVPDVFFSFRVKPDAVVPGFLEQFFLSGLHGEQLRGWVNAGVRNNGLLNLNASDFFNLTIICPSLPEQRAIAAVLSTADEEIKSLEAKCAALESQKKGLMQKLLTGEVRVEV